MVEEPSGNTVNADNVNDQQVRGVRASLMYAPDPTFRITPSFWYQENDYGDFGYRWNNLPEFEHGHVFKQPASANIRLSTLNITKDFGPVELTSLTGYLETEQALDIDYTFYIRSLLRGTPPAALFSALDSLWRQNNDSETWSEELRLQSTGDSRLRWLAGLYYSDDDRSNTTSVTTPGISALAPFLLPLVENDVVFGVGPTSRTTREYAVFGEGSYRLSNALDLTLGLRWFDVKHTTSRPAFGLFNGGTTFDEAESSENGVNPKVTLAYRLAQENLIYATASKGFRPGGPNTAVPVAACGADLAALGRASAPDSYESDSLWNFELGSKNTFANGRWTVNGTLFYIDWSDIQQSVDLACGFSFIDNVGKAHSKGVELEVQGELFHGFDASAAVVYTDAEITDTVPGVTAQRGDKLLGAPEWMVNAAAQYTFPLTARMSSYIRADYQWRDEQLQSFTDTIDVGLATGGTATIPDPTSIQDGYSETNLSIGITSKRWEAQAYVRNLFDDDTVIDPTSSLRLPLEGNVHPRQYGVGVRFRF
jgi:outer membrane receptor protein involved in Fe transport